jgi:SAM-dependent methyltransferase
MRVLKKLLSLPALYDLSQNLVAPARSMRKLVECYVKPAPQDRILDIGCGSGRFRRFLPDVQYVGFDLSSRYIAAARRTYGNSAQFFHADVTNYRFPEDSPPFDIAIAYGVVHHLTDAQATCLFQVARQALRPGGRIVTVDPALSPRLPWLARLAIANDRGQYVRSFPEYLRLAAAVFPDARVVTREDLLSIPYAHAIVTASRETP